MKNLSEQQFGAAMARQAQAEGLGVGFVGAVKAKVKKAMAPKTPSANLTGYAPRHGGSRRF